MADNQINYTQGTAGGTIATDEVVYGGATVHMQRVKIHDGTEAGTAGWAISSSGVGQTFQTNTGTVILGGVSTGDALEVWSNNGGTVTIGGVSTGDALEVWSSNGGTVTLGAISTGDALEVWPNSAGTVSVSNAVAVWPNSAGTVSVSSVASYEGKTRGGTIINLSASGTVVTAVASNYLKVYEEHFTSTGTIVVTVRNGANGSTVSGPRTFVPGGGVARANPATSPLFISAAGSPLYYELSGSGTIGGDIAWIQETSA